MTQVPGPRVEPPGLQNERTALAWQRTALSLVAGAALLSRLTYDILGGWSFVCLGLVLPLGAWVLGESRARYRSRLPGAAPRTRDGLAGALLAVMVLVLAGTQLVTLALG